MKLQAGCLGICVTNFYTAPTCLLTRSVLLSGTESHQAGIGNTAEILTAEQKGRPSYEGYLNDLVATHPGVLRDNSYSTSMTGRCHLG